MIMFRELITHSPEQTQRLGRCLGRLVRKGTVMRLCGDLGSGKTCFVQGLARGLGVPDAYDITSPTYTLINQYPGRISLLHVDLYRLNGRADAEAIGLWDLFGENAVMAVEWAGRLADSEWPVENVSIEFFVEEDTVRRIRLFGSGLEPDNLIKGALELWEA